MWKTSGGWKNYTWERDGFPTCEMEQMSGWPSWCWVHFPFDCPNMKDETKSVWPTPIPDAKAPIPIKKKVSTKKVFIQMAPKKFETCLQNEEMLAYHVGKLYDKLKKVEEVLGDSTIADRMEAVDDEPHVEFMEGDEPFSSGDEE